MICFETLVGHLGIHLGSLGTAVTQKAVEILHSVPFSRRCVAKLSRSVCAMTRLVMLQCSSIFDIYQPKSRNHYLLSKDLGQDIPNFEQKKSLRVLEAAEKVAKTGGKFLRAIRSLTLVT